MTTQRIRERLLKLHAEENDLNKEMGKITFAIKECQKKKLKIAKRISSNMKYRNKLINLL
jgi:hypothetical protein